MEDALESLENQLRNEKIKRAEDYIFHQVELAEWIARYEKLERFVADKGELDQLGIVKPEVGSPANHMHLLQCRLNEQRKEINDLTCAIQVSVGIINRMTKKIDIALDSRSTLGPPGSRTKSKEIGAPPPPVSGHLPMPKMQAHYIADSVFYQAPWRKPETWAMVL